MSPESTSASRKDSESDDSLAEWLGAVMDAEHNKGQGRIEGRTVVKDDADGVGKDSAGAEASAGAQTVGEMLMEARPPGMCMHCKKWLTSPRRGFETRARVNGSARNAIQKLVP